MGLTYLTDEEIQVFFRVIQSPRDKLIFRLMLFQGLRVSEVVGETLDYWSKNGKRIKISLIPKGKTYEPNKNFKIGDDTYCHHQTVIEGMYWQDVDWNNGVFRVKGKGKKVRMNWLNDVVRNEMVHFALLMHPGKDIRFLVGKIFDIEPPQVRVLCRQYAKEAGIQRPVHPHLFRHTFSTAFLKDGGDISELKEILGHSSLMTTEKYLKKSPDEIIKKMQQTGDNFTKRGWID